MLVVCGRDMKLFAVFFVLGTTSVLRLPDLPSNAVVACVLLITGLVTILSAQRLPLGLQLRRGLRWSSIGFFLGVVICGHTVKTELAHKILPALHGSDVELVVRIEGVPVNAEGFSRFRCTVVELIEAPANFTARRLQVTWYNQGDVLRAGDVWRLRLRVKPPRGLMNPGGFDYAGWLFGKRVHALAYVRQAPTNQRLETNQSATSALRQRVRDQLLRQGSGLEQTALMQALVVGLRTDVSDESWSVLRRTGTSHLLAISGLHIGLAATWGFLLATMLVRGIGLLGLQLNRLDAGGWIALLVASAYSVLAGLTVPTQRALTMLLLFLLFVFLRRHLVKSTPFFMALFVIVLLNPLSVLSAGFWLSFGAVGSLLYLTAGRVQRRGGRAWSVAQMFRVHTALAVLLFPMTALIFAQGSVISPLANLIAVPITSLFIVPLLLLWLLVSFASDVIGSAILWLVDQLLFLLLAVLRPLAELPLASLTLREVGGVWLLIALLGTLVLMLPRCRERWLGVPLLLPVLWLQAAPTFSDELVVDVLDVGQGLSVVVRYHDKALLYDTGGRLTPTLSMAEAVVTPFLESLGIQRLEQVVISHTDTDHAAGFEHIAQRWPVGHWQLPAELARKEQQVCRAGQSWHWGAVHMSVLYPDSVHSSHAGSDNNHSCVLRIRYGNTTVLLPGDIEKKGERQLLRTLLSQDDRTRIALKQVTLPWSEVLRRKQQKERLPVSLLLAAHHGSQTSSASSWLDYFRPERVVYAVGYRNRFGFPHETVQMRYKVRDTIAYRTDRDGAIRFRFSPAGLLAEPERYRSSAKRLWHASQYEL